MSENEQKQQQQDTPIQGVDPRLFRVPTPDDVRQVATDTTARTIKIMDLYKEYSGTMSEKDRMSFALWVKEAYNTLAQQGRFDVPDEEVFKYVYGEFVKTEGQESGKAQERKEGKEGKVSPRGHETSTAEVSAFPTEMRVEPDYSLADDEKFFRLRERLYHGTQTIKKKAVGEGDIIQQIISQL